MAMMTGEIKQRPWESYFGPNLGYVYEQYERYVQDHESVDTTFRDLFDQWGAPPAAVSSFTKDGETTAERTLDTDKDNLQKVVAAHKLIWNMRTYGHLAASIDPLGLREKADTKLLEYETYGLTKSDLSSLSVSLIWENAQEEATGWDAVQKLYQIYTKTTAYEFSHVHEEEERDWLNKQVETGATNGPLSPDERSALLRRLIQVEQFEHFLQRTFVGQKRFSIEGLDVLVPVIDEIVSRFTLHGTEHILMGMAHRGRLNVLAHILGKPYDKIFSEFHHSPNKDLIPSEGSMGINYGWTGDVKYHLGAIRSVKEDDAAGTRITLANNPSHLEFVNPIVEGFTRAAQEDRSRPGLPKQDVNKAVPVLIHGDAAFPGEGIVAETLNLNNLPGYRNGGTIHIIANNRLGFTTESTDSRSTHYASDLAKGFEIPIVHVNADDPEACIAAVRLAIEYRFRFKKDFLIDLVGYRRYGHNESDDPEATQPVIYEKVRNHPTVSALYASQLKSAGLLNDEQVSAMNQDALEVLQEAYDQVRRKEDTSLNPQLSEKLDDRQDASSIETAVRMERLREINGDLLNFPEGFHVYPKLQRILERRAGALEEGGRVDWALAETLAFAAILADGKPIRLSGQDSERGTFAHRHLVLHDSETGKTYSPLHRLPQASASFAVHNSPLSEASVLGYEYGYNVFSPETLVIWEAQYGDFANAAQVIIDQFISAGRVKWAQKSSLVLLLPHGYEGQGPEHSSARLERFLQAAAEDNWRVANLTNAGQYFHLLRRQAAITESEQARPLVLMAPKSLIRNPRAASSYSVLADGSFQTVWEQPGLGQKPERVERLILCTGKIALDLEEALEEVRKDSNAGSVEKKGTNPDSKTGSSQEQDWLHAVRIEQLYPFPEEKLEEILGRFPNLKEIVWMQEEPKNMGAWSYMQPRIRSLAPANLTVRYIGRPERSSTASGYQNVHSYEQTQILSKALNRIDN